MSGNESRFAAICQITDRDILPPKVPSRLEELWATDVFSLNKMQGMSTQRCVQSHQKNGANGWQTGHFRSGCRCGCHEGLGNF